MKTMFVVSEFGACCSSRPILIFLTEKAATDWILKQSDEDRYDWNEVDIQFSETESK